MTPSPDTPNNPPGNAGDPSKALLEEAAQKAAQLIRDTQFALDEVNQSLTQAADRVNKEGQAQLEQLTARYEEQFANASKRLSVSLEEQITAFGAQAKQQLYHLEQELAQFTAQRQQQLDKELRQQQQQKLQQFEQHLKQTVPGLIEELVGRSLSLSDHETIIKERLQQLQQDRPWNTKSA